MTGLRERLGQASARILPGASGFWAWWTQALLSWLPSRWRALLGVSDARLLLELVDGQLTVSLLQSGQRQLLQTLPGGSTPNAVDAALPPRVMGLPRFGLLSASAVLRKPLRLPAAAEARLREVLGFEIDRQTPFSTAQVYYDVRLLQRRDDGQLDTELVVAPRPLVDTLLGPGEAWQQQLDGVDAVDAEGQPLGVNLLPQAMRRQRHDPMRRLNRLLLIAGLVMMVLAAWQLLDNRRAAARQLSVQVDAAAVRARAVAAQRQQLQDLVDGQQFFTAQRALQASATEIINELSQRLGDDTSLEKLSIEGGRMQLIGMSSSASSLVSKLEGSKLWKTPSLTGVLQAGQGAGRERFTLTAELRGPNQEAADGTAPPRRDRWLALGLLLAVLGVIYLLLVQPLWTRPMLAVEAEIAALQERQQRIGMQLRQAPQVAQRLQQAQQTLADQPGFMAESSAELATSKLVQRLEEAARLASPDQRSCAISDRSPLPADSTGRFPRVAVQARLRCGMSEWMSVLQTLETGTPQLRVDRLDILSAGMGEGGGGLDVSFELSGYLRPGVVAAATEVANAQ